MFDNLITPCILSPLTSSVYTHCIPSVTVAVSHLVTYWTLGTHYKGRSALGWGDVALGITPPYYCHTGYIPSVIVAVSHLVHTEHWVHRLGARTQQATILLSLAFLNITQDFKNLDSGQKKNRQ